MNAPMPETGDGPAVRTLSSRSTFILKFIFMPAWLAGFGIGTLAMFLSGGCGATPGRSGPSMRWVFPAGWGIALLFFARYCAPLKRVRVKGDVLYISNYLREIRVPLSEVTGVIESHLNGGTPVTVNFRAPTAFGQKIIFNPPISARLCWKPHSVADELRALVLQAGGSSTFDR